MQNCPHCGASLPPVTDAFCQSCLQALDEPVRTSSADEPLSDQRPMAGLACGAIVGFLSGCATMGVGSGLMGAGGAVLAQVMIFAIIGWLIGSYLARRNPK